MSCDKYQVLLQDYVARELDPERRRRVDAHLLECAECQRELAILSAVISSLDHQPVLEPSADFTARVISRLPRQRSFYPNPWWTLALAPVLGVVAWLLKPWVTQKLASALGRAGQVKLPEIQGLTMQQLAIVPLAVLGLAVLLGVGAYFGWRRIQEL